MLSILMYGILESPANSTSYTSFIPISQMRKLILEKCHMTYRHMQFDVLGYVSTV